jgi:DNA-binding NarL/FixJ family response regulator
MVDDLPAGASLAIESVATEMRGYGYEVAVFDDGREALRQLAGRTPRVVVASIVMGSISLRAFLEAIESADPDHKILRVVITVTDPQGGPWRDWSLPCHAFVLGRTAKQLHLTIEQAQWRGGDWPRPPVTGEPPQS